MGHVRVISRYSDGKAFCPINFPKSTKTQRNKQVMRQRTAVFPHILLHLQICKFVCTSAAFNLKRVPGELYLVSLIKLNRGLSRI